MKSDEYDCFKMTDSYDLDYYEQAASEFERYIFSILGNDTHRVYPNGLHNIELITLCQQEDTNKQHKGKKDITIKVKVVVLSLYLLITRTTP